jgi:hypothetical protein
MPGAPDKSQFDLITFRKLMRMLDSANAGERANALTMALRLCEQNKPPLLFFEAAALAFGTGNAERDRFQNRIAQLESQIAAMDSAAGQKQVEMAQLADQFIAAKKQIAQLIARSKRKTQRGTYDFHELLRDLWTLPQIRLICLTLFLIGEMTIFWRFETAANSKAFEQMHLLFVPVAAVLFAKWTALQYREEGLLQLLVKWALFLLGAISSFGVLRSCWPWETVSAGTVGGGDATRLVVSIFVLAFFSIVTLSRLSEWLVEEVGAKLWESQPIQTVRGYF